MDLAGGEGAEEGEGFSGDFFGGAAVEFFDERIELIFLLFGAEIVAEGGQRRVVADFQAGFF